MCWEGESIPLLEKGKSALNTLQPLPYLTNMGPIAHLECTLSLFLPQSHAHQGSSHSDLAVGHGVDMSYILTATFLSEGDEGRRRVITSQKTDQGDRHEGTGTHVSVSPLAASVYLLSSKMPAVGLTQCSAPWFKVQHFKISATHHELIAVLMINTIGDIQHTHPQFPLRHCRAHLCPQEIQKNNFCAIPPTDQHSSFCGSFVHPGSNLLYVALAQVQSNQLFRKKTARLCITISSQPLF